jgi:glycosyltransferase involved in cell wall biosynthesis
MRKIPIILWGHAGSRSRNIAESSLLLDKFYRWIVKKSSAFIVYSYEDAKRMKMFMGSESIFVAQNTLDVNYLFKIRRKLDNIGRKLIKQSLNLRQKNYISFIGRLSPNKLVDELINVYVLAKNKIPDLGLIIIGDGEKRLSLEEFILNEKIEDIVFTGTLDDWRESGKYLYCSDVMVIPGAVGLSVNHSLSFGVPVITSEQNKDGPYHGPEIEYILDGMTGFKCKNGNHNEFVRALEQVFKNKKYFYNQSIKFCEGNLLLENMVNGIVDAIKFV